MEEENHSQLELFSQAKDYGNLTTRANNPFITYIRNYERTILIIIGFIITGVISFSLGIEKGKRTAMLNTNAHLDLATKIQLPAPIVTPNRYPVEKQEMTKQPETKTYLQNYTIQVASYQTQKYAQKEAEVLKQRGIAPLVLSKGSYSVICVGNFSNKETAKSLLSELKKQYRDCFIRRL